MPKTNFCKDIKKERRNNAVKEMLEGKKSALGISTEVLAKKTGIKPGTLYKRQQHPETMRLDELWKIIDVLKPEEFYLRKIFDI